MRAVVQRVRHAAVRVAGVEVGAVGVGLLVLLGVGREDTPAEAVWLAGKVAGLRIFPDGEGQMNRSLADVGGSVLSVSQFTLYGDVARGRRPSFVAAARPEMAEPLWLHFNDALQGAGVEVATGRFGADMDVDFVNWGPVTLILDTDRRGGEPL
jgi:D-tyrosyl-tRNA(Tyr) deacylase